MRETSCATPQAVERNAEGHSQKPVQNKQLELPKTAEELQMVLQVESDRRVTQALKTSGIKWQQKMIRKLAAERREAERLANLAMEKREKEVLQIYGRELENKERALKLKELELKMIEFLLDKKLPVEFKDFVLSKDEESSIQKAEELGRLWNEKLQEALSTHSAVKENACHKGL